MVRTIESFREYLRDQETAFEKLSRDARQCLSKETVHQLRVTTRRLRAALWLLERSSERLRFKKVRNRLGQLTDALGEVRELDVAIKDAKEYGLGRSRLKRKRRDKRKALRKILEAPRQKRLASDVREVLRYLRRDRSKLSAEPAIRSVSEKIKSWIDQRDRGDLHQLRIEVKKARYALETVHKPTGRLSDLQDALGRAHDLAVLKQLSRGRRKKYALKRDLELWNRKASRMAPQILRATLKDLR